MLGLKNTRVEALLSQKNTSLPSNTGGGGGLVVGVILAVGVALLQGRGRRARGGGAGGFDPGLGQQGGGHGDLDELVALNQPDERFEALERRLRVSLLPQQPLPQIHALLRTHRKQHSQLPVNDVSVNTRRLCELQVFYIKVAF